MIEELVEAAEEAQKNAHVPYSGYKVGAAVMTVQGDIYSACNVEAKPSANTLHAEQRAMAKAVEDGETEFLTLALVTPESSHPLPPCGNCRQTLATFQEDLEIVVVDGEKRHYYDLDDLLPDAYTGRSMDDAPTKG